MVDKHQTRRFLHRRRFEISLFALLTLFYLGIWSNPYSQHRSSLIKAVEPNYHYQKVEAATNAYSGAILSEILENPSLQEVEFNWFQFYDLESYFKSEAIKRKMDGLSCQKLSNLLGRPQEVEFHCEDREDDMKVKLTGGIVLFMTQQYRILYKNLYLSTGMPNPDNIVYLLPHPQEPPLVIKTKSGKGVKNFEGSLKDVVNRMLPDDKQSFTSKAVSPVKLLPDSFTVKDVEKYSGILESTEYKYFTEGFTLDHAVGGELDWRFMNKKTLTEENFKALQLTLMRAWSHFAQEIGVNWWLAGHSLLGWYWNGLFINPERAMNLHMPIGEVVEKLYPYNNSIIFDYRDAPNGVYGQYFLDINPYSIKSHNEEEGRKRDNLVDIRFIDMRTGLLIDITAFRKFDMNEPFNKELSIGRSQDARKMVLASELKTVLYDKTQKFFPLEDVSPLVPTFFENELAYVPHDYRKVLEQQDDKCLTRLTVKGYKFRSFLRMWIPNRMCKLKVPFIESTQKDDFECLANQPELKREYEKVEAITSQHEKQMLDIEVNGVPDDYILYNNLADRQPI